MKNLSECELPFHELNDIPRSSRQKQQTFQKVICEISRESETKRQVFPKILTYMFSLAACFLFVFIIFTETDLTNSTSLLSNIEGKEIVKMGIAPSKLKTSFLPIEEDTQKNSFVINDDNWSQMVFEMLQNAEISTIKPATDPAYDLLITLNGPEILKIKVWEEEGEVYLKELGEDEYHHIKKKKGKVFIKYVNSLNHYIEN